MHANGDHADQEAASRSVTTRRAGARSRVSWKTLSTDVHRAVGSPHGRAVTALRGLCASWSTLTKPSLCTSATAARGAVTGPSRDPRCACRRATSAAAPTYGPRVPPGSRLRSGVNRRLRPRGALEVGRPGPRVDPSRKDFQALRHRLWSAAAALPVRTSSCLTRALSVVPSYVATLHSRFCERSRRSPRKRIFSMRACLFVEHRSYRSVANSPPTPLIETARNRSISSAYDRRLSRRSIVGATGRRHGHLRRQRPMPGESSPAQVVQRLTGAR